MFEFFFTPYAAKQFKKLPKSAQLRIKRKLYFWSKQKNPLKFATILTDFGCATHRFRIGDYRIICRTEKKELIILVLKLGHRKNVYKK